MGWVTVLVRVRVTALVDGRVFTALVRMCKYENTACPSIFITASLSTIKMVCTLTFVSAFIPVICCAWPPYQSKWIAGQALQQAW